jgi:hypothetical protein
MAQGVCFFGRVAEGFWWSDRRGNRRAKGCAHLTGGKTNIASSLDLAQRAGTLVAWRGYTRTCTNGVLQLPLWKGYTILSTVARGACVQQVAFVQANSQRGLRDNRMKYLERFLWQGDARKRVTGQDTTNSHGSDALVGRLLWVIISRILALTEICIATAFLYRI